MAYSTQTDIENVFGQQNVKVWSDLDGDGTLDSTRVAASIAYADEFINSLLRGGVYAVPIGSSNVLITNWSAVLAGAWLYRSRGLLDSAETDKIESQRLDVESTLAQVNAGVIELDIARSSTSSTTAMDVVT